MTYRTNREGVITSVSSGRELIGSKIKSDLHLLDWVMIKRPNRSREPKYGIYGGKLTRHLESDEQNKVIIRTVKDEEILPISDIVPIEASDTLVHHFVHAINNLLPTAQYSGYMLSVVKFYLNFVNWRYPELSETLHVPVCSECGAPFPNRTLNGTLICDECYHNRFTRCDRCGRTVARSETINGCCEDCALHHWITQYHRDTPPLDFFGDTHNNAVPYLGVELEVAYGGESNDTVRQILPLINSRERLFMYCSHDSSLEDGFENITQPATLEYHESIENKYKAVFHKLRELDYLSHDTPCCGMHVHFNRNFYPSNREESCIARLCFMFEHFWKELLLFSRRVNKKMRYCRKINMSVNDFIRRSNRSSGHDWHYYALNLANESTIEFRIFRGTLNINTFMATLELVNNMIIYSRDKSNEEIQHMRFEELLTTDRLRGYWDKVTHVDKEM